LVISIHFGVSGAERPRLLAIQHEQMRDRDLQPIVDYGDGVSSSGLLVCGRSLDDAKLARSTDEQAAPAGTPILLIAFSQAS
jgi:hypothetical protein